MDTNDFRSIEFGICSAINFEKIFFRIPIDDSVRNSLVGMHDEFYKQFFAIDGDPLTFEPSEKYSSTEKIQLPLPHENLDDLKNLFDQQDILISQIPISEIANSIVYYFAVFYHNNGEKKIGIKRPSQFKGLLNKQNHLIRLVDDTLRTIPDDVFKLDFDFDFVIYSNSVDILHPKGFIFIANIEEEILRTAAVATRELSSKIAFINFNYLADFVSKSKTAAKLVASIKKRADLERTSIDKLKNKCQSLKVIIREEDDKLVPEDNHIIDFLKILDRREYDVDLTEDEPEIYVASSRKINPK